MDGYWSGPDNEVWTSTSNWWTTPSGPPNVSSVPGTVINEKAVFYAYGVSQNTTHTVYFGAGPTHPVFLQLGNNQAYQLTQGLVLKGGTSGSPANYSFYYAADTGGDYSILIGNSYGGLVFDESVNVYGIGKLSVYADPLLANVPSPVHFYGNVASQTQVEITGAEAHFYKGLSFTSLSLSKPYSGQADLASVHIEPTATFALQATVTLGESTALYFKGNVVNEQSVFTIATSAALYFNGDTDIGYGGAFNGTGTVYIANKIFTFRSLSVFPTRDTILKLSGTTVVFSPGGDLSRNFGPTSLSNGPSGEYVTFNTNGNNISFNYPFNTTTSSTFGIDKTGVGMLSLQLNNSVQELRVLQGTVAAYAFSSSSYGIGNTTAITLSNVAGVEYNPAYYGADLMQYVHNLSGGGLLGGNLRINNTASGTSVYLTGDRDNTFAGKVLQNTSLSYLTRFLEIYYDGDKTLTWTNTSVCRGTFHKSGILKMGGDYVFDRSGSSLSNYLVTSNYLDNLGLIPPTVIQLNGTTQSVVNFYASSASVAPFAMELDFGTGGFLEVGFGAFGSTVITHIMYGSGTLKLYNTCYVGNPNSTFTGSIIINFIGVQVYAAQYSDKGALGDLRDVQLVFAGGTLYFPSAAYLYDYSANLSPSSTSDYRISVPNLATLTFASPITGTQGLRLYSGPITTYNSNTNYAIGTLRLLGSSTYAGGTRIQQGIVQVGSDTAVGTGTIYIGSSDSFVREGKTVGLSSSSTTQRILANGLVFYSGANPLAPLTVLLGDASNNGTLVLDGDVALNDTTSTTVTFQSDVVFGGTVTRTYGGSHLFIKKGNAKLTLSGSSVQGKYQVDAGTLEVASATALGTANEVRVSTSATLKTISSATRLQGRLTLLGGSLVIG